MASTPYVTNDNIPQYVSPTFGTQSAVTQTTAAAPATTVSTTAVMVGVGAYITPNFSSRVEITACGVAANTTINDTVTLDLRISAVAGQAAPVNGAAVVGTLVGIAQTINSLTAAQKTGFSITGIATGLVPGSKYWVDLTNLVNAGGSTLTGITVTCIEII